ncbi:hypothetical protein [Halalkalibacter alkalisediminis]|uniref:Transposase n=1 Tax=Halalkalibacter alkalisediminis TaxID=935616 RepID=A0ABV6NKM3_9BACI|nr:hypothetical protein [Halalkalibacter alkalisediminis]
MRVRNGIFERIAHTRADFLHKVSTDIDSVIAARDTNKPLHDTAKDLVYQ